MKHEEIREKVVGLPPAIRPHYREVGGSLYPVTRRDLLYHLWYVEDMMYVRMWKEGNSYVLQAGKRLIQTGVPSLNSLSVQEWADKVRGEIACREERQMKRKTRRLKVLPLEWWMKRTDHKHFHRTATESFVKVGRDGWYLQDGDSWFEYKGKAYIGLRGIFEEPTYKALVPAFLHRLRMLEHRPLRDREREALSLLLKEKTLDRRMRDLLYTDNTWRELRWAHRRARMAATRIRREVYGRKGWKK
jgi:hypothetical protein